jgi:hypothetical protein
MESTERHDRHETYESHETHETHETHELHERHELIEVDLLDAYYGEKELSAELKTHLDECSRCRIFWEQLPALTDKLAVMNVEVEVDERVIHRAFREANSIKALKKERYEFYAFLLIAMTILGMAGWLAGNGYAMQIIAVQLLFLAAAPLGIPVLIWRRLA